MLELNFFILFYSTNRNSICIHLFILFKIFNALNSNPPSSIEILNFYPGSVGVNSSLMFDLNTFEGSNSLNDLINSAIVSNADASISKLGGLVDGSVQILKSIIIKIFFKFKYLNFF